MIDPKAVQGTMIAVSNVVNDKGIQVPNEAVEKFKMFGVAIRNKTVTYDLLDEISKLCKSLRRDISERRKKHRQSVKRQKKMNTAKNANKLTQSKDKHG